MRIGPIVHGLLLLVALLFAYRAWSAGDEDERDTGDIVVWNEPADSFQSLTFTSDNKEVLIERRGEDGDRYLWGQVTRTRKKVNRPPSPHPAAPGGADPHGADPHGADPHGHGAAPQGGEGPGAAKQPAKKEPAKKEPAKKGPAPAKKATPAKGAVEKTRPTKESDGSKAHQNDQIQPADDGPPAAGKKPAPGAKKPAPGPKKAAPAPANDKPAPAGKKPEPGAQSEPADGEAADGDEATDEPATAGAADTEEITSTREFPVGEAGEDLVKDFSQLRAMRELGALDDEAKLEYGLDSSQDQLTVEFAGGKKHTLLVGDRVFGGSERYVLDEGSGKGYVLAGDVMRNVDAAETALGLKSYHAFDLTEDLERLAVKVEGTEQVLVKLELEEEEDADQATPKTRATWARAETPDQEDVTMANFVDRVSKLRPIEYLPDLAPESLTRLAQFSYQDASGKELGYMTLYKGAAASDADPEEAAKEEYYMKTEKTRVLGRVSRLTAERVDSDLTEVFSGSSSHEDEAPADNEPAEPAAPVE